MGWAVKFPHFFIQKTKRKRYNNPLYFSLLIVLYTIRNFIAKTEEQT